MPELLCALRGHRRDAGDGAGGVRGCRSVSARDGSLVIEAAAAATAAAAAAGQMREKEMITRRMGGFVAVVDRSWTVRRVPLHLVCARASVCVRACVTVCLYVCMK